jgi:hypothetical protein
MTESPTIRSTSTRTAPEPTAWVGWVIFAGIMLMVVGAFQAIDGLVALFKDEYYVVRPNGLVLNVDFTAWGWTHLILGILLLAAGAAIFSGRVWGRTIGVIAALLSAVVNFAFIAAYPLWSVMIITLDVLVIYALVAHGGEMRQRREA